MKVFEKNLQGGVYCFAAFLSEKFPAVVAITALDFVPWTRETIDRTGSTKGGSITLPLTSCLTGGIFLTQKQQIIARVNASLEIFLGRGRQ